MITLVQKHELQSIDQSSFVNAITQVKKYGRLSEQAIAQQSWPP